MTRHLIDIESLPPGDAERLIARAAALSQGAAPRACRGEIVQLFWEPSTRTRVSFEFAAHRLGLRSLAVDPERSSSTKGETLEDTCRTLAAMQPSALVVRHAEPGTPQRVADALAGTGVAVVNAGDGSRAHPTQALLDAATLVDEGSGLLVPYDAPQLADHPSFRTLVTEDGCDLVCGSGDKLLGGPQAGLLAGRREAIRACRHHPLYRALRPDRTALAALEEVLRGWLSGAAKPLDGLWPDPESHDARLARAAEALDAEIVEAEAFIGGGSAPERPIPGQALALDASTALAEALRSGEKPVVGYLREGRLVLDLRTVDPADDADLIEAVLQARKRAHGKPSERKEGDG